MAIIADRNKKPKRTETIVIRSGSCYFSSSNFEFVKKHERKDNIQKNSQTRFPVSSTKQRQNRHLLRYISYNDYSRRQVHPERGESGKQGEREYIHTTTRLTNISILIE